MMANNLPPAPGQKRKSIVSGKIIIAIALIGVIGVGALFLYLYLTINSALSGIPSHTGNTPISSIHVNLAEQDLLTYNNGLQFIPYGLVSYSAVNVSNIYANETLLKYAPPSRIYILNISNECFNCGNTQQIEQSIYGSLMRYNIINSPAQVTIISISAIRSLPNDSILIMINGLMPASFLDTGPGNISTLNYLMNRHTSIIYVGQNFTKVLLPDSIVTPTPQLPSYLRTAPYTGNLTKKSGYYFNRTTFSFLNGSDFGRYLTYENINNGSIAAFSNTPVSWGSPNKTGSDIAKAVEQLFWLPKYAYGARTINAAPINNSFGEMGVLLNSMYVPYNASFVNQVDAVGAFRVAIRANASYFYGNSNNTYQYITARPALFLNGTFGMGNSIIINQTVPLNFQIITGSSVPQNIQPHLTIYTLNMSQVYSTPLPFIHNVSGNFSFLTYKNLQLAPGTGYIMKLHSFYGTEYAASFFNISKINLFLVRSNISADQFSFSATSNRQSLNNLEYTMVLNNLYPSNGIITNGTIYYAVPTGTPTIHGNLNFTLTVNGGKTYYQTSYNPLPFAINQQYIEIAVVVVLMLVMIIFVRAPSRDEFYIDVPNLPEEKKIHIKVRANEVMGVFDKLNTSYHWKYMPLSKTEIRSAIASNIKYNNIPVGLTYSNVERILDQLTVNKYLITEDNLYVPAQWINQSRHDIEYLATFKKLRIFLVTHAYIFTDVDMSTNSDIVATLHSERKYIVIYSKTSRFQKIPVYTGSKTYIVFLNAYRMEEFRNNLYNSGTVEAEELKMYIAADYIKLVDADNPDGLLN